MKLPWGGNKKSLTSAEVDRMPSLHLPSSFFVCNALKECVRKEIILILRSISLVRALFLEQSLKFYQHLTQLNKQPFSNRALTDDIARKIKIYFLNIILPFKSVFITLL